MSKSKLNRLRRVDRLELAQRHFEGSKTTSLQKRFCINESDVQKVIKQFQSGSIFRKTKWQPHFFEENTIQHPIGKDAYRSLTTGNGDDPFLSPLDPDLDVANGLLHLRWTKTDIDDLLYGLVKRSFTILKEGNPSSVEYKEELEFSRSDLFFAICNHLGLDGDDLKSTFEYKRRRQSKATSLNARFSAQIQELLN